MQPGQWCEVLDVRTWDTMGHAMLCVGMVKPNGTVKCVGWGDAWDVTPAPGYVAPPGTAAKLGLALQPVRGRPGGLRKFSWPALAAAMAARGKPFPVVDPSACERHPCWPPAVLASLGVHVPVHVHVPTPVHVSDAETEIDSDSDSAPSPAPCTVTLKSAAGVLVGVVPVHVAAACSFKEFIVAVRDAQGRGVRAWALGAEPLDWDTPAAAALGADPVHVHAMDLGVL